MMIGTKIVLYCCVIFFTITGVYLKISGKVAEGNFMGKGGWAHSKMTGNFVLFLALLFMGFILYIERVNRNAKK